MHGIAPDIAGKNLANPLAAILSFAMMLRYSLELPKEALIIEKSIAAVLDGGMRTADIMEDGGLRVSTDVMGDALLQELEKQAEA